jgi:acyl-ACP thioesterase
VARLLQDVAEDDAADADLGDGTGWMLRRTALVVERFPTLGEDLDLATACTGTGARWAERTTVVVGDHGARLAARAVWVAIDRRTGAPTRLDPRFHQVYGPSAGDRRVRLRRQLPPPDGQVTDRRPWPLRVADLDVWGHANNAVAWAALEDVLPEHPPTPLSALVEHVGPLVPTSRPQLLVSEGDPDADADADAGPARTETLRRRMWLVDGPDGPVLVAGLVVAGITVTGAHSDGDPPAGSR